VPPFATYDLGDPVTLAHTFSADPTTVTLEVRRPSGMWSTVAPTKVSPANYSYVFTPDVSGVWRWKWTGIGPGADVETGALVVRGDVVETVVVPPTTDLLLDHQAATTGAHGLPDPASLVVTTDARLSDQRTPLDGSVTDAKVAAANKDGAAGTPSLRTLGTGAQQAARGNIDAGDLPAPATGGLAAGTVGSQLAALETNKVGQTAGRFVVDSTTGKHEWGPTAGGALDILLERSSLQGGSLRTNRTFVCPSVRLSDLTDALLLADVPGTNGRRISIRPHDQGTSTKSSQLELVPGAAVDPANNITSQILLMNKTGANYERFVFSCFNNEFSITSSKAGTGIARPIRTYVDEQPVWEATTAHFTVSKDLRVNAKMPIFQEATAGYISQTYTDLGAGPSVTTPLFNNKVDLSRVTEVRFQARVNVAGAAGSWVRLQYSADNQATWAYMDGASGPEISIAAAGTFASPWVTLAAAAKADVHVRVVAGGGDGVADPQILMPLLQGRTVVA
jgi:hypothetical protein